MICRESLSVDNEELCSAKKYLRLILEQPQAIALIDQFNSIISTEPSS